MTRIFLLAIALSAVDAQRIGPAEARVAGIVVTGRDAAPVRRAIVKFSLPGELSRSAVADDNGRFAIAALPPGRYIVSVSKPGFVTTTYGERRGDLPPQPFVLAARQSVDDLRLVIRRGAVISGTVRDIAGEPAADIQVFVAPARDATAPVSDATSDVHPVRTDDRGEYRIFGLGAGDYVVGASPFFPGISDVTQLSREQIDVEMRALDQRNRGAVPLPPAPTAARMNFANVFHPSTTIASQAARIALAEGENRSGVDIALQLVRTSTVEGVVIGPDGEPAGGVALTLPVAGPSTPLSFRISPSLDMRPGADGRFRYVNVPPGTYTLSARSTAQVIRTTGNVTTSTGRASDLPAGQVLWATTEFNVSGDDLSGVTLRLRPAASVRGRIVFDRVQREPPSKMSAIRITVGPSEVRVPPRLAANGFYPGFAPVVATASDDGTFDVRGVPPGSWSIGAIVPGATGSGAWWLRSATLDGRDLLDGAVDVGVDDVTGVVLTFSDRHTSIAGRLLTPDGQPAADHVIAAIPADRELWAARRRLRATVPGTDGAFEFIDLPPGNYLLVALTDLPENWRSTDVLAQLSAAGVKVTLAEGGRTRQDLSLTTRGTRGNTR
jgi:hypothetical protein